jgi:hypothetical protein
VIQRKKIIIAAAPNAPKLPLRRDLSLPEVVDEGDAAPAAATDVAEATAEEAEGPLPLKMDNVVATTRLLDGAREVESGAEEEAEGTERVEYRPVKLKQRKGG